MGIIDVSDDRPLTDRVADLVRRSTHGRIRNLEVEESRGQVEVRGEVRTWHSKQLALQAALDLLSGERLRERIVVIGAPTRTP